MQFSYEATNRQGKTIKGKIVAHSERGALRDLKDQGLMPFAISPIELKKTGGQKRFQKQPKTQDIILVIEEMSILLDAGVSLSDAIGSVATSGCHPMLADAFDKMNQDLKRGSRFSDALTKHMKNLPPYVHQLVAAGEMTGDLDKALKDSATQMNYDYRMRQEIKGALTYPAILIFVGITAVVFIFVTVVPKFSTLFKGKEDQVPWITNTVMGAGLFFANNIQTIAISLALIIGLIVYLSKKEAFRIKVLETVQHIPLFGTWLKEAEISRWAATLSSLLHNSVPLMESLMLARKGLKLPAVQDQMQQVETAVRGGSTLAVALSDYTNFSQMSINLVRVGEKAGKLADMLGSLSLMYERSGRDRMKQFLTLIEPASIVIIGGVIGLIFAGIILGITTLSDING
jgi:general secretion pathway protein F